MSEILATLSGAICMVMQIGQDRHDYRSTSGSIIFLAGPITRFPLGAKCAKQTITSFSTPESELVAANLAVRMLGIPFLGACEKVIGSKLRLTFNEDNQSAPQVIKTGKNSTVRHLPRAHGISISALHDYCKLPGVQADIFTKCLEPIKWDNALELLGMSPHSHCGKAPP